MRNCSLSSGNMFLPLKYSAGVACFFAFSGAGCAAADVLGSDIVQMGTRCQTKKTMHSSSDSAIAVTVRVPPCCSDMVLSEHVCQQESISHSPKQNGTVPRPFICRVSAHVVCWIPLVKFSSMQLGKLLTAGTYSGLLPLQVSALHTLRAG